MTKIAVRWMLLMGIFVGNIVTLVAEQISQDSLDYAKFQDLVSLVPQLPNPRLASLTEEGQKLWVSGQMIHVSKLTVFLEGDFNHNGRNDNALLLATQDQNYLLIAEEADGGDWELSALLEVDKGEDQLSWNGQFIKLSPNESFVVWKEDRSQIARGPEALYQYEIIPKYTKMVEEWSWQWNGDVNLLDYVSQYSGKYEFVISQVPRFTDSWGEIEVKIKDGAADVYSWQTNPYGAFLVGNEILYYTEFSTGANGMSLVAYDFINKKQLWASKLQGLGEIPHSRYRNWGAHLSFTGDDVLEIIGKEIYGGYVEFVNTQTGKTIAHKVFKDE